MTMLGSTDKFLGIVQLHLLLPQSHMFHSNVPLSGPILNIAPTYSLLLCVVYLFCQPNEQTVMIQDVLFSLWLHLSDSLATCVCLAQYGLVQCVIQGFVMVSHI